MFLSLQHQVLSLLGIIITCIQREIGNRMAHGRMADATMSPTVGGQVLPEVCQLSVELLPFDEEV